MAARLDFREPTYIPGVGFLAVTITNQEVWGDTWSECAERQAGADEVAIDHARKCPEDNPFAPDLLDLAAEEPTSQIRDAADAAGYPGY